MMHKCEQNVRLKGAQWGRSHFWGPPFKRESNSCFKVFLALPSCSVSSSLGTFFLEEELRLLEREAGAAAVTYEEIEGGPFFS